MKRLYFVLQQKLTTLNFAKKLNINKYISFATYCMLNVSVCPINLSSKNQSPDGFSDAGNPQR